MHWIVYFLLSLLVALPGLFAGGVIGAACVRWYRVSSFEGGSGYFVMAMALAGALAGLVTGLVTMGICGPPGGSGYTAALGMALAAFAIIAGVAALLCRLGADLPPVLDGRPLVLEVEIRLPVSVAESPAAGQGESSLELHSVRRHRSRGRKAGTLRPLDARCEDGRWIVPGEVPLFTRRGHRALDIILNGETLTGFMAPLPPRPGRRFLEWSDWGPKPRGVPWPDTMPSWRFRIRKA